jgi:cyclophilin family peptidyl-prolyl cis-trans isomerase
MALLEGPLGHGAVYGLGTEDSVLLLELLESPENGKRTAALETWMERDLPLDAERVREFSRNSHWLVPLFLAWILEEEGEHDLALLVHETVTSDTGVYDDPVSLVHGLESMLGLSDAAPGPDDSELPFDPDTVAVPDTLMIATDIGQFKLVMWKDIAPVTCASFTWLARQGFYDGIWFHRVIPGFVAQAGCPDGTGMGGPGYTIPNERSLRSYGRGVVGMADAGLDTGGSQFFVMLDDHNRLDGRYTAFGEIVYCDGVDDLTVGSRILWIGDYRH